MIYSFWSKVFGQNDFLLYISYKTTIFENIIPKSILVRFNTIQNDNTFEDKSFLCLNHKHLKSVLPKNILK
jgi:hypothetical protein